MCLSSNNLINKMKRRIVQKKEKELIMTPPKSFTSQSNDVLKLRECKYTRQSGEYWQLQWHSAGVMYQKKRVPYFRKQFDQLKLDQSLEPQFSKAYAQIQMNETNQKSANQKIKINKTIEKQEKKCSDNFSKLTNFINNVMVKHLQMKTKIQNLKKQQQLQKQKQVSKCTFQPKIYHNPRYNIAKTFDERQSQNQQVKFTKKNSLRQSMSNLEMRECTFRPRLQTASTDYKTRQRQQNKLSKQSIQWPLKTESINFSKSINQKQDNFNYLKKLIKFQINGKSIQQKLND